MSKRPKKSFTFVQVTSESHLMFFFSILVWGGTQHITCMHFNTCVCSEMCAWVGHMSQTEPATIVLASAYYLSGHMYTCRCTLALFCTPLKLGSFADIAFFWAKWKHLKVDNMNLAATICQSSLHNFLMRTSMSQNPIPKMFGWTGVCECKLTHTVIQSSVM